MTTTAMPQPVVWRVRYPDTPGMIGQYPWSYAESMPKSGFNPLYEIETLITTKQAEAYATARVREALEEATQISQTFSDVYKVRAAGASESDARDLDVCAAIADEIADAIRALIPK